MDLEQIKCIVRSTFDYCYTNSEKLIYLGGTERINHCSFIIVDKNEYDIIAKFNVSPTNIYEATHYRATSSWQLEHWTQFITDIKNRLSEEDE